MDYVDKISRLSIFSLLLTAFACQKPAAPDRMSDLKATGVRRAGGFGRFFEALFSSAVADEIVRFVCSRVRRFAPYPLAR
jgi:hypothetical protein